MMDIDKIQRLVSGKLRGKQKKELEKIIETDPELQELYTLLKQLSEGSLASESELTNASKRLSAKIFSSFSKSIKQSSKKLGVQLFDSSLLPLPEGIRPASVDTKTLKFIVADSIVELSFYPITTDSVEVIGIFEFQSELSVQVVLRTKNEKFTTELDQYSLFRFARIPNGTCKLSFYEKSKLIGTIEIEI